jgi:hypothetical protein
MVLGARRFQLEMQTSAPPWPADVFAPGEVGDVDLDGRALGADADFAVAAQRDGPDVAGRNAIGFNHIDHAGAELLEREGQIHAVDFGRVEQALHVLGKPKTAEPCGWP